MRKLCPILVILFGISLGLHSQDVLNLEEILRLARMDSYNAQRASATADVAQQDFRIYQSRLKPSLNLQTQIPSYFQSSSPITQPNGTIEFQRIAQNNSSFSFFAIQEITSTGGKVFVQSDLTRFDDFTFNNSLYNGVPFRAGIIQPIFGYNELKWQKKIEPLRLSESKKQYNVDVENTQLQAANLYFQILIASENLKIARLNTDVNERLLKIAKERLALGKISEDEKLQLEIELDITKVNFRQSEYALYAAEQNLWTYLGAKNNNEVEYQLPQPMEEVIIDLERAINMARVNRPELIAFQKRATQADQSIAIAKANTGIQADLFASFGLARGSQMLSEVYTEPFTEQQISLSISVPILDWGKRKSTIKKAEILRENELASIRQEQAILENAIELKILEFTTLQRAVQDQSLIRNLADKRFGIANERYVLGAISVTDWTLAQREKDLTRRNYIQTLSNYWISYYELRLLTGYDFNTNQKITY